MVFQSSFLVVLVVSFIGYLFSQEGAMVTTKFRREYLPCTYDFLKMISGISKPLDCIAHCLDIKFCVTIKLIPIGKNFQCILLSNGTQLVETPALEQNIKLYTKDACKQWIKIDHVNENQTEETYYFISQEHGSKNYASTKCNEFGPNVFLAEFENWEKFDALKTYMASKYPGNDRHYWIGLTYDTELNGTLSDRNSYTWDQMKSQGSFMYWRNREPNDHSPEYCVRMVSYDDFRWGNKECDPQPGNPIHYICEIM